MRPIFENKMLIYQSKANLDVKIPYVNITHLIDSEMGLMLERSLYLLFLIPLLGTFFATTGKSYKVSSL